MTGTTITSSSTLQLNLTAASQNPVTVTKTGTISSSGAAAIYGTFGLAFTIVNAGLLRFANPYYNTYGIILGGGGTVLNTGTIEGTSLTSNTGTVYGSVGVALFRTGSVTNGSVTDKTALISGALGVRGEGVNVTNFGTIAGGQIQSEYNNGYVTGAGVVLFGGVITNGANQDAQASISGFTGVDLSGTQSAELANFGTISGSSIMTEGYNNFFYLGTGVRAANATITNGSATDTRAYIRGVIGVEVQSGGVTNYGMIVSTGTYAFTNTLNSTTYQGIGVSASTVINGSVRDNYAYVGAGAGGVAIKGNTVVNYGRVSGAGTYYGRLGHLLIGRGVYLTSNFLSYGALTNGSSGDTGATIRGGQAVYMRGLGTLTNFGSIEEIDQTLHQRYGSAVLAPGRGTVINGSPTDTSANIDGYRALQIGGDGIVANYGRIGRYYAIIGISIGGVANVSNRGTIEAYLGTALALTGGGTATNAAGATIAGATGVVLASGATLTVAGTIIGTTSAIDVTGGAARVVLEPGADIKGGIVAAGSKTTATLELANGVGSLASGVTNFGTVVLDAGARWHLSGTSINVRNAQIKLGAQSVLEISGSLQDQMRLGLVGTGTLAVGASGAIEVGTAGRPSEGALTVDARHILSGSGTVRATIIDNGRIVAAGGLTLDGAVSGKGAIGIARHSVLTVDGVLGANALSFLPGGGETLKLGTAGSVSTRFSGFNTGGNTIDLLGVIGTAASFANDLLSVRGKSGSVATLHFTGSYTAPFGVSPDHNGGTLIMLK